MEDFDILQLIGEGSYAKVFKARNRKTNATFALKFIPKGVQLGEDGLKSLRQEFKIHKRLDHPNIVKVHDAFESPHELIVVTEFVPNELHKLFGIYKGQEKEKSLSEARLKEIAADILSALHYLHTNRILHRDLKPQNILIDDHGRAKLCDFGFARNLGMKSHVLTSIKGTPLYMAPELIEEQPYDQKADLWSVGCILYELRVGHPPFQTNSLIKLISKVRYDSVIFPDFIGAECKSFVRGLLEKDARKRLNWPEILEHPFIKELMVEKTKGSFKSSLTEPMSESQELAKEIQRREKAKMLAGGSQTLIKLAKKYEQQKQSANNFKTDPGALTAQRRNSDSGLAHPGMLPNPQYLRRHSVVPVPMDQPLLNLAQTHILPFQARPGFPEFQRLRLSFEEEWEVLERLDFCFTELKANPDILTEDKKMFQSVLKALESATDSTEILEKVLNIFIYPQVHSKNIQDLIQFFENYSVATRIFECLILVMKKQKRSLLQLILLLLSRLVHESDKICIELIDAMEKDVHLVQKIFDPNFEYSLIFDILLKLLTCNTCRGIRLLEKVLSPSIIQNFFPEDSKSKVAILLLKIWQRSNPRLDFLQNTFPKNKNDKQ